jgi:uncharacterized phage-like protein YoqJ
MTACSFTGHRVIAANELEKIKDLLARAIDFAYDNGVRTFNCGGALGFDTLAALAVLKKKEAHSDVRLVLYIPCADQCARWNKRDVDVYNNILAGCDEQILVSEVYDADCMRRRNEYLAQNCDMLVAYVNKERSGAAQTVRMARALGKKVYNLFRG